MYSCVLKSSRKQEGTLQLLRDTASPVPRISKTNTAEEVFNPGDDVQSERHIDSTGRVLYRKPVIPELAFVRWLRKESCTSLQGDIN